MKKMFFGAAFAAASVLATPAAAQNAEGKIGGGRLEVLGGYDRAGFDAQDSLDVNDTVHMSGILYGIGVGYDVPVSKTVSLGVDLEASDSTTKRSESYVDVANGIDIKAGVKAGRDLYAGGRLTVAVSRKVNVYLKAGYTNARMKLSASGTVNGTPVDYSDGVNGDGVRGGVGAQFSVSRKGYIGVEYRYSNYESDFTRNQVAATFGLRF